MAIDPSDIIAEARANMWVFSPTEDQARAITTRGVRDFIKAIGEERRSRLAGAAMLFYCWHDRQARQLRFSLVSQSHGSLPFGCIVRQTDDPNEVARSIVKDDWCNPKWPLVKVDTDPAADADSDPTTPHVLTVFVLRL